MRKVVAEQGYRGEIIIKTPMSNTTIVVWPNGVVQVLGGGLSRFTSDVIVTGVQRDLINAIATSLERGNIHCDSDDITINLPQVQEVAKAFSLAFRTEAAESS